MSVDVKELEKSSPVTVEHEFRWRNQVENGAEDFLPLFEIKWGSDDDPKVIVEIDGRTKKLLRLRLEDDSISKRNGWNLPAQSRELLNKITDAGFLAFSAEQRNNLVMKVISTNMAKTPKSMNKSW